MVLLTTEELRHLTGKKQGAAQIRALRAMGVPYLVRPDGKPVVRSDWGEGRKAEPTFGPIGAIG